MVGRFDLDCGFKNRYEAVEALMDAANARIYVTEAVYNSKLRGCTICDRYEIDHERYALDTDITCPADMGDHASVTYEFIDGIGSAVTMVIINRGTVRETYIYDIEVDPEDEAYDGTLVRTAIASIKAHDTYRKECVKAFLGDTAITQRMEARHNIDGDPHIVLKQDIDADAAADIMATVPDCAAGDEGIDTVVIDYEPRRLPDDLYFIPVGVAVRDNVYHFPARKIISTWWVNDFEVVTPAAEPNDPRSFAAFCGAREY